MHVRSAIGQTGAWSFGQASSGEAIQHKGGRDDQTLTFHTVPAMRQVRRRAVHTAHLSATRRGEAVRHTPPEREVRNLRTVLLRLTDRVNHPRASALTPARGTRRPASTEVLPVPSYPGLEI